MQVNIFILNLDPDLAARDHCDRHVLKMCLESTQMLCAAHPLGEAPWKRTHYNHPCTVWARSSVENYRWLSKHALALFEEYTRRYGRRHKAHDAAAWCSENIPKNLPVIPITPFALAIKDKLYHRKDPVSSYRAYYIGEKARFARWRHSATPDWWIASSSPAL